MSSAKVIQSVLNGYVVDVLSSKKRAGVVVCTPGTRRRSQGWDLDPRGLILNCVSGYALTIESLEQGSRVVVVPAYDPPLDEQRWEVDDEGAIVNALRGFVLDIKGASTADLAPLIAWPRKYTRIENQRWRILNW